MIAVAVSGIRVSRQGSGGTLETLMCVFFHFLCPLVSLHPFCECVSAVQLCQVDPPLDGSPYLASGGEMQRRSGQDSSEILPLAAELDLAPGSQNRR